MTECTQYILGQYHCGALRRDAVSDTASGIAKSDRVQLLDMFASGFLHVPVVREDLELVAGAHQLTHDCSSRGNRTHTFCRFVA